MPSDPSVLQALSAVLGIDVSVLFEKAGVDAPLYVEASPTIEESLGSLAPAGSKRVDWTGSESAVGPHVPDLDDESDAAEDSEENLVALGAPAAVSTPASNVGFVAPSQQYLYTTPAPPVAEVTYMEDESQRQMYRIRHLATLVVFVALLVMFVWAMGHGWDAFTGWWDDFVGNLQL